MSVLTGKNVLVVGEDDPQIKALEECFLEHNMTVSKSACENLSADLFLSKNINIVLINFIDQELPCEQLLKTLQSADLIEAVPVLALVENNEDEIQKAFSHGIADYFTNTEDIETVLQKVRTVLGEGSSFDSVATIDISPSPTSISKTGIKVYVVEDDPLLRNLLSVKFDRSSFPYEFSNDGRNVLAALKQFRPDVIILDLMLPGKSGLDILAEVKADDSVKNIPVIVFSNRDGQGEKKAAKDLGADAFYVKAMTDLSELVEKIEDLVK